MHDNAGIVQEVDIKILNWPACSPDLNPIEHSWDDMGRQLKNRQPACLNDIENKQKYGIRFSKIILEVLYFL